MIRPPPMRVGAALGTFKAVEETDGVEAAWHLSVAVRCNGKEELEVLVAGDLRLIAQSFLGG
ncbi:MAG: hypothetical protein ABR976_09310 [Terracidiphilus sp.]